MGPVHLYLAAWVAGGVLLGASMLLDGRERAEAEGELPDPQEPDYELTHAHSEGAALSALTREGTVQERALRVKSTLGARSLRLLPLGLIGFGLSGLTAKGLNFDLWPWTFVCALGIGACLIAGGYRLSRVPRSEHR
jgi:hypothetical protein